MNQASAFGAICAASYLEDYLYCAESLPDVIQRSITKIRQLDSLYCENIHKVSALKSNALTHKSDDQSLIHEIKSILINCQAISDEQLKHLSSVQDLVEVKSRRLEQESKNLDSSLTDFLLKNEECTEEGHCPAGTSSKNPTLQQKPDIFNTKSDKKPNNAPNRTPSSEDSETSNNNSRAPSSAPTNNVAKNLGKFPHRRAKRPQLCSSDFASRSPKHNNNNTDTLTFNKMKEKSHDFPSKMQQNTSAPTPTTKLTKNDDSNSNPNTSNLSIVKKRRRLAASNNTLQPDCKEHREGTPTAQTRTATGSRGKFNVPVDPDEPTYCLCDQVSYGEMIGCDNNDCLIEWYHFNCVGLGVKPKGKWYCPNCRGDRPNIMKE